MSRESFILSARGEVKINLLLRNARLVNLLSGEIYQTDVAVHEGEIVGFGEYNAKESIDLNGKYLAPGLIDGHVHIESSMLSPVEFAKVVLPLGTTTIIADPHEIANVLGLDGIRYMVESVEGLPVDIFYMLPSCVPATHLETSGAVLTAADMKKWIDHPRILGVGEMMNFPAVLSHVPDVLDKIAVAGGKAVDGHAPLLSGKDLSAYIGVGITSDHESTNPEEALEKLRKGMFVMIREGSAARNLDVLMPLVTPVNSRNFGFVTDDRHPDFLMNHGHINSMVKQAIRLGLDPVIALQMASLNTARHYHLEKTGAIAPGFKADMIVFDDFEHFNILKVYKSGRLVAENGRLIDEIKTSKTFLKKTIWIKPLNRSNLKIPAQGKRIQVISVIPNQILTKRTVCDATIRDGEVVSNVQQDVLKVAVIERHHATGNVGLGFVKGIGLKSGAIASTVAHDSHNLIVVGTSDDDIIIAVREIEKINGGQIVVENGNVKAVLPLPIAGLMSDKPLTEIRSESDRLNHEAHRLGCLLDNPFMTLSFLALPVIPELKITDKGLVDVDKFAIESLFVE